ncbi:hypothetical protein [Catenovulum sediminis]|uniref:Uncharacterized protein n=1 Tax=Catenovulum sediminis TaxID=1740262 RepID=A0ABV1RCM1_9ALTE|nr:hypothetical protein [Catenovulum sediminis]
MPINAYSNGLNSAILNSTILNNNLGVQSAVQSSERSQSPTALSYSLPQENQLLDTQQVLANAAAQQIGSTSQILKGAGAGDPLTNQLVSFSVNANNTLSTLSLDDVTAGAVGRIINETI